MLIIPTVPFPEGFGASVHFAWPGKEYIPLGVYVYLRSSLFAFPLSRNHRILICVSG